MICDVRAVEGYDEKVVYEAVCASFAELGIAADLRPGMRVAIKPNMIMGKSPAAPVSTHPLVVRAVARWLREQGVSDVTLAESSSGPYTAATMRRTYRACHMNEAEPYVTLGDDFTSTSVPTRAGFANQSFDLLTPIVQADYVINVCKLKTHAMTSLSAGVKNLFGCIPGLEKPQLHYRWPNVEDFSNMLLELAQTVAPQVTVIDAITAMEGNGPTGGMARELGLLMASRDIYTQDCLAAALMGFDVAEVATVRQSVERGLARPEELELTGDAFVWPKTPFTRPDAVSVDFTSTFPAPLRAPVRALASRVLKSYPELERDICVGCGKCAESCPAHVIEVRGGKAHFSRRGCISCFCCQEVCPAKAIRVSQSLSTRFWL